MGADDDDQYVRFDESGMPFKMEARKGSSISTTITVNRQSK